MTVVTWGKFVDVMIAVKPSLLAPGQKTINDIITWARALNWIIFGVNQTEVNWIRTWIATLSLRFIGESKADLLACVKFLGWINKGIPLNQIDTKRVCVAYDHYWYDSACHASPDTEKPPPPYEPPEPENPIEFMWERSDFYGGIIWEYGPDIVKPLMEKAIKKLDYWMDYFGDDWEWAWDAAVLDIQLERITWEIIGPLNDFIYAANDILVLIAPIPSIV
ncbi:unnamed protein product [marine sediment metagenome]|uniref:Uncharacterized protein n=1 Tax=marine sediment metagenome TaxID=412755 RepID=X1FBW8_9ZZZZ